MAKIISMVASKGGVGKTTVSAVIADELAKKGTVAVLDCDCDQYSIEGLAESKFINFDFMTVEDSEQLLGAVKAIKGDYDYIICDTAPHSHTEKFFLDILKMSDTVIGITQPAPTDILAFQKIMLNLLNTSLKYNPKQKQFLLVNRVENISSDIQNQSLALIDQLLTNDLNKLTVMLHSRAAYKAHGYFKSDEKKDKKKIMEVQNLVEELRKNKAV